MGTVHSMAVRLNEGASKMLLFAPHVAKSSQYAKSSNRRPFFFQNGPRGGQRDAQKNRVVYSYNAAKAREKERERERERGREFWKIKH